MKHFEVEDYSFVKDELIYWLEDNLGPEGILQGRWYLSRWGKGMHVVTVFEEDDAELVALTWLGEGLNHVTY